MADECEKVSVITKEDESIINVYKLYREYVMKESDLSGSRLGWILTINGIILAVVGAAGGSLINAVNLIDFKHLSSTGKEMQAVIICVFIIFVSTVAWAINYLGQASIEAAQDASALVMIAFEENLGKLFIKKTKMDNEQIKPEDREKYSDIVAYQTVSGNVTLPGLRGGGSKVSIAKGIMASRSIPQCFKFVWLIIFAISGIIFLRVVSIHP